MILRHHFFSPVNTLFSFQKCRYLFKFYLSYWVLFSLDFMFPLSSYISSTLLPSNYTSETIATFQSATKSVFFLQCFALNLFSPSSSLLHQLIYHFLLVFPLAKTLHTQIPVCETLDLKFSEETRIVDLKFPHMKNKLLFSVGFARSDGWGILGSILSHYRQNWHRL